MTEAVKKHPYRQQQPREGELFRATADGKLVPVEATSTDAKQLGISDQELVFVQTLCAEGDLGEAVARCGVTQPTGRAWLKRPRVAQAMLDHGGGQLMVLWLRGLHEAERLLESTETPASAKVALIRHLDERVMGRAAEEDSLGEKIDPVARLGRMMANMRRLKGLLPDKPDGSTAKVINGDGTHD